MTGRGFFRGIVVFGVLALTLSALIISGCSRDEPGLISPDRGIEPATDPASTCEIVSGDFSQGFTGWVDANEGPGLPWGVQEIVDVDGRDHVLHLDSRDGGNYYLFRNQIIPACGILGKSLMWDWKLAQIERDYGLAAVWMQFLDSSSNVIGKYFVRRDTGDFPQYDCSEIISTNCGHTPPVAVGCERTTGTTFGWETYKIDFTAEFFDNLHCNTLDPSRIESIKLWIQSYNNAGAGVDAYFDNFVYAGESGTLEVAFDIKPGSCPNPLNPKSKGKLPAAILGTADFDVRRIDVSSIRLEGVAPIRSAAKDVSRPVEDGGECACTEAGPDGYDDLTLKFETQDIVAALGRMAPGDVNALTITGALLDGTPFEGRDCVVIVGRPIGGGNDEEWIVFARENDVWRARPDGTDVERIVDLPAGAQVMGIAVSPDASQVAYLEYYSEFSSSNRLALVDIDGSNPRTLVNTGGNGASGVCDFDPDGTHVMYYRDISLGGGQNYELYEVALDGSSDVNLTNHTNNEGCGSYSPGGDRIAFASGAAFCSACGDIYVQNRNGTGRTKIFDLAGDSDNTPKWSPDGARILISSRYPADQEDLYLIDPDGSNPVQLTHTPGIRERHKAWSPDGSRIVFERSGNLYFIDRHGSNEVLFLENAAWPDWAEGTRTVVSISPPSTDPQTVTTL